jgi:hypothetical protein
MGNIRKTDHAVDVVRNQLEDALDWIRNNIPQRPGELRWESLYFHRKDVARVMFKCTDDQALEFILRFG